MSEREFDVVVIGSGPAGEVAAARLSEKGGKRVAIVERELVGGECSFWACMPSKALLRPQELLREAARVPGAAEAVDGNGVDAVATLERRDQIVNHLDDGNQVPWLQTRGITLVRGHGRLVGERRVQVGDDVLAARDAVIVATGTGALIPPIPGLREASPWTSRELATAKRPPERLVIIGGGVVGVEMAQAWHSLGSEIVLVEAADRLLFREEPFAGDELAAALSEQGVELHLDTMAAAVERDGEGVRVALDDGEVARGTEVAVAIGRRPLTDDIGLDTIGLQPGESIAVDDQLRVPTEPWLYAVGDVNGRILLTHMGKYQARLAADHILGDDVRLGSDGMTSPRVIFPDPQVAAVGHTLASARASGIRARAIDLPTSATAGASFYGRNAPGTTRFVVDERRALLVGATFVGPEVGDLLHAATIAVSAEVPLERLAHAVAPFPTRSELWLKFIESYGL